MCRLTKEYSDNKRTFSFSGEPMLSDIPQLAALYAENDEKMAKLDKFIGECEEALAECLKKEEVPPVRLTDAIATCKVQVSRRCTRSAVRALRPPFSPFLLLSLSLSPPLLPLLTYFFTPRSASKKALQCASG